MIHVRRSRIPGAVLMFTLGACARGPRAERIPQGGAGEPSSSEREPAAQPPVEEDSVHSVYSRAPTPPDPRAVRLCDALQETPTLRAAACRGDAPGVRVTSECRRTLSEALRLGAVRVSDAEIDRCVAATNSAVAGCAWARAARSPAAPPPECQGLVRGALPDGARCRSSLECSAGSRCRGVGPTSVGRCAPPLDSDLACGGSVDALAVYTRQNGFEADHPECRGRCERGRCVAGPATLSAGASGPRRPR